MLRITLSCIVHAQFTLCEKIANHGKDNPDADTLVDKRETFRAEGEGSVIKAEPLIQFSGGK